jgi:endonuclease/exonuclease/phosphatase family metal-dependent hydrolase
MGYPGTDVVKADGLWCSVHVPSSDWNLKSCPLGEGASKLTVKVLTYNLFWWNLFDKKGGSGRSAGKLIAETSGPEQYDIMAFQECDDRHRVLRDAKLEGLLGEYEALDGGRAVAIMYLKSRWTLLAKDSEDVGEDDWHQHYGKRTAQWVRLQHTDGRVVFFVNHHGPLPVGWGGGCTGSAAAYNIMRVIADHAHPDDAIVLVGDFNAPADSSRIRQLDSRLNRVFSGREMGGVDHIFTNCAAGAQGTNLGKGRGEFGSDHDALSVTFEF